MRTARQRKVDRLDPPHDDIVVIHVPPALDTMTKAQLMQICRDRHLSIKGKKADLIERIEATE